MSVPISNVTRRVVFAPSGVGPYAFTFEILAATDIEVYKGDNLLTLTTDYTVTINANGTGSVTLVLTAGTDNITIVGARAIQRTTDFNTGGDFFANTLNDELDSLTIFAQQNAEGLARSLQAPETDPTTIDMTLPRAADRADKFLAFDSNGNPVPGAVPDEVQDVLAIEAEIIAVAAVDGEIATLAGISGNIETVAGISGNVTTVAGISSSVTTVAGLSSAIAQINANEGNIDIVAGLDTEIAALGPIASSIQAVGNFDSATLVAVGNLEAELVAVSAITSEVVTVAGLDTEIAGLYAITGNIETVAGISADVTSVAGISAAVSAVNSNATNINAVATDLTGNNDIGAVADIAADVSSVAGIAADVTTVANIGGAALATVGNIDAEIVIVSGIAADVSAVSAISASVQAVGNLDEATLIAVGNIESEITTVAGLATEIGNLDAISSDITTVATNIADVTNFANVYLGPAATDPATRNDSSALQEGDLYFNTTDDAIKVYTGAAWTVAYVPDGGFLVATNNLSDLTSAATARDNLGLGNTDSPTFANLTLSGAGAIQVPVGNTDERPSPVAGMLRFNNVTPGFEGYDGSNWGAIAGGGTKLLVTDRSGATVEVPLTNGFLVITNRAGGTVSVPVS